MYPRLREENLRGLACRVKDMGFSQFTQTRTKILAPNFTDYWATDPLNPNPNVEPSQAK